MLQAVTEKRIDSDVGEAGTPLIVIISRSEDRVREVRQCFERKFPNGQVKVVVMNDLNDSAFESNSVVKDVCLDTELAQDENSIKKLFTLFNPVRTSFFGPSDFVQVANHCRELVRLTN